MYKQAILGELLDSNLDNGIPFHMEPPKDYADMMGKLREFKRTADPASKWFSPIRNAMDAVDKRVDKVINPIATDSFRRMIPGDMKSTVGHLAGAGLGLAGGAGLGYYGTKWLNKKLGLGAGKKGLRKYLGYLLAGTGILGGTYLGGHLGQNLGARLTYGNHTPGEFLPPGMFGK